MKELFICSPEHYASEEVQLYIRHKLRERDKQWIYELIKYAGNGAVTMRNHETVHIDTDAWMLCRDVHPGRDTRYLVVFKDRRLLTVRDLDGSHVGMLANMQDRVALFMRQHHGDGWRKYRSFFHYMPSVYQLHAHVSAHTMPAHVARRHHFRHIIGNIRKTPQHYARALILTSRALRSSDWK